MRLPKVDLAGMKFHKLTVLHPSRNAKGTLVWTCKCECGTITHAKTSQLNREEKKSCGCLALSYRYSSGQHIGPWPKKGMHGVHISHVRSAVTRKARTVIDRIEEALRNKRSKK